MIGLIISLTFLILFLIPLVKKRQRLDIYIIFGLYFTSTFLALFFDPTLIPGFVLRENYNDFLFVLYGVLVCYSLSPLYSLSKHHNNKTIYRFTFQLKDKTVFVIAIIGGIYSIIYSLPYVFQSLALGGLEVRTSLAISDKSIFPPTIWTTIAVGFSTFSTLYLGWFFLSLNSNLKKHFKAFLFIISLSYIFNSLAYTARDGLLFFMIFSAIFLIVFWHSFTKKTKKNMIYIISFISFLSLYFLFIITSDRFSDGTGITGYIATQPYVFAENITQRIGSGSYYGTSHRLPFLNIVSGVEIKELIRSEPYEWTFGTYLTDFFNISGFTSLITLLVLFTEFFRYQFNNSETNSWRFIIVYILFIHFIVSGLFYFRLGTFSGNVFILVMIFYALSKPKKNKI